MTWRIGPDIVPHLRTWGLHVVEDANWQTRERHPFPARPVVIVCHHTGTPDTAKGNYPTRDVIVHGRSELPGPLAQFGLGRDGTVYLFAAGVCNHAGKGTWDGVDVGNDKSVGIEAESSGNGTDWTPKQLAAYPLLCAALCAYLETTPRRVCGHKESARPLGRKDDPHGIDMAAFRKHVTQLLRQGPPDRVRPHDQVPPTPITLEDDRMQLLNAGIHRPLAVLRPDGTIRKIDSNALRQAYLDAGATEHKVSEATFDLIAAEAAQIVKEQS